MLHAFPTVTAEGQPTPSLSYEHPVRSMEWSLQAGEVPLMSAAPGDFELHTNSHFAFSKLPKVFVKFFLAACVVSEPSSSLVVS